MKTPANTRPTARLILAALREHVDPEKAAFYPKFFRAMPGGYGAGDRFLGVVVPKQRAVAKRFRELSRGELDQALDSPWHEMRLTALLILVDQYRRADRSPARREIVDYYLQRLNRVNNWDLVDSSAPYIVGPHVLENAAERKLLRRLGRSGELWPQRVAVVANLPLIKAGEFDELLWLCERLLDHPHDLIHKATGWMLREMGKQSPAALRAFLAEHVSQMPRTMLRYSIEKLPPQERKQWLAR